MSSSSKKIKENSNNIISYSCQTSRFSWMQCSHCAAVFRGGCWNAYSVYNRQPSLCGQNGCQIRASRRRLGCGWLHYNCGICKFPSLVDFDSGVSLIMLQGLAIVIFSLNITSKLQKCKRMADVWLIILSGPLWLRAKHVGYRSNG